MHRSILGLALGHGCNKLVFTHTDALGSSKYTLYKRNYKYEENSYNGSFSVWGKYEVKDTQIQFLCKDKVRFRITTMEECIGS
ncbi:MAG: hypothetical protein IPH94_15900 [Saprospiraceae bacterium]|nr:hypothetical protein [Saprospiraceae bacterium]